MGKVRPIYRLWVPLPHISISIMADINFQLVYERGMIVDPSRRLFVSMRDAVDERLAERLADDLHAERQSRFAEPGRHR